MPRGPPMTNRGWSPCPSQIDNFWISFWSFSESPLGSNTVIAKWVNHPYNQPFFLPVSLCPSQFFSELTSQIKCLLSIFLPHIRKNILIVHLIKKKKCSISPKPRCLPVKPHTKESYYIENLITDEVVIFQNTLKSYC